MLQRTKQIATDSEGEGKMPETRDADVETETPARVALFDEWDGQVRRVA